MKKLVYPDQRSKKFILVPFCLMCQAFQARGIVRLGFTSTMTPIIEELLKYDVNIIQMPCPESLLGGYEKGLQREPKGYTAYQTPEFLLICEKIARGTVEMIEGIIRNGFEVVAIMGIEYSPSCSIKFQYTNKGNIRQSGHFIEALGREMDGRNIKIPFIGINRRNVKGAIKQIQEILEPKFF